MLAGLHPERCLGFDGEGPRRSVNSIDPACTHQIGTGNPVWQCLVYRSATSEMKLWYLTGQCAAYLLKLHTDEVMHSSSKNSLEQGSALLACTNWERRKLKMNWGKKASCGCSMKVVGSSFL